MQWITIHKNLITSTSLLFYVRISVALLNIHIAFWEFNPFSSDHPGIAIVTRPCLLFSVTLCGLEGQTVYAEDTADEEP